MHTKYRKTETIQNSRAPNVGLTQQFALLELLLQESADFGGLFTFIVLLLGLL